MEVTIGVGLTDLGFLFHLYLLHNLDNFSWKLHESSLFGGTYLVVLKNLDLSHAEVIVLMTRRGKTFSWKPAGAGSVCQGGSLGRLLTSLLLRRHNTGGGQWPPSSSAPQHWCNTIHAEPEAQMQTSTRDLSGAATLLLPTAGLALTPHLINKSMHVLPPWMSSCSLPPAALIRCIMEPLSSACRWNLTLKLQFNLQTHSGLHPPF